jgi:PDDEXK-like domain of unknown function (DUF3799)
MSGSISKTDEVPALSASIAKILWTSTPWHAWTAHPRLNPNYVSEEKEMYDLGSVAHALMLEGLENAHIIQATRKEGAGKNRVDTGELVTDYKTTAAREERDAARDAGKTPILACKWDNIRAMVLAGKAQIAAHKEAADAFTDGLPEQTITWTDRATDGTSVVCRSRLDWLKTDKSRAFDYKTTATSINPRSIANFALSQMWDIQAVFYLRGLAILFPEVRNRDFLFVVQETEPPYALCIVGLGPDFLWAGEQKVQKAIDTWAACMMSGVWPGFPDRIVYPILPSYEENKILEFQMGEK